MIVNDQLHIQAVHFIRTVVNVADMLNPVHRAVRRIYGNSDIIASMVFPVAFSWFAADGMRAFIKRLFYVRWHR